ncbi:hypothetical protein [Streptomyces beihaiensis]|uniref:Uncharacterized protein n=1 Tax=Streptomyces beihaiensis TaxID=2984495 RepID=A0ABT3TQ59_9ACTN|nr:hypothetical protein [Streptomyces beihaiensis]MCX3058255.1 hypothetical protein [Streptomyces beihaiensis]
MFATSALLGALAATPLGTLTAAQATPAAAHAEASPPNDVKPHTAHTVYAACGMDQDHVVSVRPHS